MVLHPQFSVKILLKTDKYFQVNKKPLTYFDTKP